MKVTSAALGLVSSVFGLLSVEGHGDIMNIIHTCTLIEKSEPTGPYEPYTPMVDGRVAARTCTYNLWRCKYG